MINNISVEELKDRLDKGEVILVDVREPAEYKTECINGSCLIPLSQLAVEKLPSRSKPIVVQCGSGKRSMEACKKLLSQDPTINLYNLDGGISAWKAAGETTAKSGRKVLPLERQVQLTAGFLAFSGTMLGAFVSTKFYILPGFVGCGLMFAGITGWCGTANLLTKMPWNK